MRCLPSTMKTNDCFPFDFRVCCVFTQPDIPEYSAQRFFRNFGWYPLGGEWDDSSALCGEPAYQDPGRVVAGEEIAASGAAARLPTACGLRASSRTRRAWRGRWPRFRMRHQWALKLPIRFDLVRLFLVIFLTDTHIHPAVGKKYFSHVDQSFPSAPASLSCAQLRASAMWPAQRLFSRQPATVP